MLLEIVTLISSCKKLNRHKCKQSATDKPTNIATYRAVCTWLKMDESVLNKLLLSDPKIKVVYGGLFSKDVFPSLKKQTLYICQTANSTDIYGEHFIVLERELTRPGVLTWACSYATNPKDYPLIYAKIKQTKCQVARLHKPLQKVGNDRLSNCASWSLFYAYHLARGISLHTMAQRYFYNHDPYKLNIFVVCVIRALYSLRTPIKKLLFNKKFVEAQEKREKWNLHGDRIKSAGAKRNKTECLRK